MTNRTIPFALLTLQAAALAADVPEPVFGGAGVPAPAFGLPKPSRIAVR